MRQSPASGASRDFFSFVRVSQAILDEYIHGSGGGGGDAYALSWAWGVDRSMRVRAAAVCMCSYPASGASQDFSGSGRVGNAIFAFVRGSGGGMR